MSEGHSAYCSRCGALLYRYPKGGLDTSLALSLAALILFLLANAFPFMTLEIEGRAQETTLAGAFWSLYQADRIWLSVVVLFTSIIGPSIVIISGQLLHPAGRIIEIGDEGVSRGQYFLFRC